MSQSLLTGLRAVDLEGRITFVNAAFCRMTGFSEAELVGVALPYPYWPPEEAEQLQRNIDTALAGRAPPNGFEMRIMNKSGGKRFDVRLYFSPIDTQGKQIGWMASMNDITEPKRTRVELEQAHERFETVIDGSRRGGPRHRREERRNLFAQPGLRQHFRSRFGGPFFGDGDGGLSPGTGRSGGRPGCPGCENAPARTSTMASCATTFRAVGITSMSRRSAGRRPHGTRPDRRRHHRRKHLDEVTLQQQAPEQTSRLITMGEMASSLAHELNQPSAIATAPAASSGSRREPRIETSRPPCTKPPIAERAGKIIHHARHGEEAEEPRRGTQAAPRRPDR